MHTRPALILAATLLAGPAICQPGTTTPPPTADHQPHSHSLADLAFLRGEWTGTLEGDTSGRRVDELWSAPAGSNITGCFRWLQPNGTPMVLEMLTIAAEPDAIRLRLRHFSATLESWETDGKAISLTLAGIDGAKAEFVGGPESGDLAKVVYDATVPGSLRITVEFAPGPQAVEGRTRPPLVFALRKE